MIQKPQLQTFLASCLAVALMIAVACAPQGAVEQEAGEDDTAAKIPVTTSSDEAREAFLTGRNLNEKLRARGFEVYDPDMSMFTLGGGGVHCMCQALRRD